MGKKGPNCYDCKHRHGLPGSCHSCCEHPKVTEGSPNPLAKLMATFASVGRVDPVIGLEAVVALEIQASSHGIKKGWFNWPWNFDPVWLEACSGFEALKSQDKGD